MSPIGGDHRSEYGEQQLVDDVAWLSNRRPSAIDFAASAANISFSASARSLSSSAGGCSRPGSIGMSFRKRGGMTVEAETGRESPPTGGLAENLASLLPPA